MTQGHQIQKGLSRCGKQPFSENRVQIGESVWLEFCSLTDRQTDTHTQINCNENITPFCGARGVITGQTLKWVRSFLTGRNQRVMIGGVVSQISIESEPVRKQPIIKNHVHVGASV